MEFAEFYESSRDDRLRIVLLHVGDRQLAEELVAEGFARAWVSWRKVRVHPAPQAWVVRTALNTHVTWWRRRRREVVLGDHDVAVAAAEDTAISADLLTELRRLPLRQRQVITLRFLLDLVLDAVGGEIAARALTVTADGGGRIGLYGFASGQWPALDAQAIATRGLTVSGPLGVLIRKPDARQREDAEQALAAAARGELRPRIHARFPLEKAADAHRELEQRRSVGAIVLTG